MVKLYCAIAGAAGSVFSVEIDETLTVDNLKTAITKVKKNKLKDVDADELQLFLAKENQGEGAWLTEAEVKNGVNDTTGLKPLDAVRAKLHKVQLSESDVGGVDEADEVEGNGPVHVLVVLPGTIFYSHRPPKPLVKTSGAAWDFQNPLNDENLSEAIRKHFDAWKAGYDDKKLHPLFTCLSGPGTGKSRLLDEFPKLLKDRRFAGTKEDPEMIRLLQNAFTFKVTFENGTPHESGFFSSSAEMIGTRMLYQLQDSLKWDSFVREQSRHSVPSDVLKKLNKILGIHQRAMCVILCVDSMQKLTHENGSKDCEFYKVLNVLSGLVNASKCWVIAICSATIYSPVSNFLVGSSQWRYQVPTAVLSRPTVNGEDIFAAWGGNELIELLIGDMGGLGRALEILYAVMQKARQKGPLQFMSVITAVLTELRIQYPGIEEETAGMQDVFLAVIARRQVDKYSRFGKLSLDQVISTGLVRREDKFLTCPYVLYLLVNTPNSPWSNDNFYAPQETREDAKPWQTWETFNCKFRALKSVACQGDVNWEDIHSGARFGTGCDRDVIEQPRTYSLCVKHMTTKLDGFGEGATCSCKYDPGKYFLYQPAQGSPSGDSFTCVKDVKHGFFHEVHQCKKIKDNFPLEGLLKEKEKAAGPADLFLLYCTSEVEGDIESLVNCAVVDRTCWKEYYGPFAARAFYVSTVPPPELNTSTIQNLQLVPGIGPAISKLIAEKRPYSSLEDAHERTGVDMTILSQTSCKKPKVEE